MNLSQSKILVTGATGFIGRHLERRLRTEKGASVRALVRDPAKAEGLAKRGVELFEGEPVQLQIALLALPVVRGAKPVVQNKEGSAHDGQLTADQG